MYRTGTDRCGMTARIVYFSVRDGAFSYGKGS